MADVSFKTKDGKSVSFKRKAKEAAPEASAEAADPPASQDPKPAAPKAEKTPPVDKTPAVESAEASSESDEAPPKATVAQVRRVRRPPVDRRPDHVKAKEAVFGAVKDTFKGRF